MKDIWNKRGNEIFLEHHSFIWKPITGALEALCQVWLKLAQW